MGWDDPGFRRAFKVLNHSGEEGVTPSSRPLIPDDYDTDVVRDLAVFDGYSGGWYIATAAGAVLFWGQAWGWPGAISVPGAAW